MLKLNGAVLNFALLTDFIKGMNLPGFLAFRQGFVGEFKPVIGQDVVDAVGVEADDCLEKSGSSFFILLSSDHDKRHLGDSVDRRVDVPALSIDLGGVKQINMEIADAVVSKLPDLPFGADQLFRQTGQAVSRQDPINLHRIEIGDVSFQGEEDVLDGFLKLFPLKQDSVNLLGGKIGSQLVGARGVIFQGIPALPLLDRSPREIKLTSQHRNRLGA